jgi:excisionase family DNA binding protein
MRPRLAATNHDGRSEPDATPFAMAPRPDRDAAIARRLLTADEVAALLGVPRSFVYALARRGELPTVRIGERYVRFREEALDRWIAQRETTQAQGTQ